MSADRDIRNEMPLMPFPDETADRLLSGEMSPTEAPSEWIGVAGVFQAAAGAAAPHELQHKAAVVAACAAEVLSPLAVPAPISRSRTVISRVLTAKAATAAAIVGIGLGSAAAAAAATGSLPGQTTHANSHATSGLTTAAAHSHATSGSAPTGSVSGVSATTKIPSTGPANQHAQFGLCTAFLASVTGTTGSGSGSTSPSSPPQYSSTAFKALIAQNGSVAATTTYCQHLVSNKPSASANGQPAGGTSSGASNDHGQGKPSNPGNSANHTTPGSHAPVSTPNGGGTGTADTASQGASSTGSATANAASGGASAAGSGNAANHH
jgi:hypothetical protein